jgi:hypothetical protein
VQVRVVSRNIAIIILIGLIINTAVIIDINSNNIELNPPRFMSQLRGAEEGVLLYLRGHEGRGIG